MMEIAGALVIFGVGYLLGVGTVGKAVRAAAQEMRSAARMIDAHPEHAKRVLNTIADKVLE